MARNSSGTYQRIGNSFTAPTLGTTIDPGDAEAFWDELDSEITDSLSRSGKGGMLADLDMNEHAILSAASIGLTDTDTSHTLTIGAGSNLTANRTLTLTTGDADRTWSVLGNLTIGGNVTLDASFTTSGHGLTLTTTSITNVTLPVSGTLATLAGSEILTNKTMSGANNTFANLGTSAFSDDAVTNAKLANMGEATIKGRNAGVGTGDPTDLSGTTVTAILNNFVGDSGSGGTKGLVPAPAAGDSAANKFLSAGGAWSIPSGAGDVAGPAGVTENTFALFNGVTGKVIKAGREVLLTDRIYWVRTDGNDSNTGLSDSAGAAFLTWQGAYDAIVAAIDFNGNTVTIRAGGTGARTFAPGSGIRVLTIGGWIGGGALTITGDATTPTNVLLSSTAADAIRITGVCPGDVTINALELRTTTGGYCINNAGHARVLLGSNLVFGATANAHIATTWRAATIEAQATGGNCYRITGGGAGSRHIDCDAGLIQLNLTASQLLVAWMLRHLLRNRDIAGGFLRAH